MNPEQNERPLADAMQQALDSIIDNVNKLVQQLADKEAALQKAETDKEAWQTAFIDMQRDKNKADIEIAALREQLDRIHRIPPAYNG